MLGRAMLAVTLVVGASLAVASTPATAAGNLRGSAPTPPVATGLECHFPTYPSTFLATSVRLDHDVTCPRGTEWNVGPGITVDLNGHTVTLTPLATRSFCGEITAPTCNFNVTGGSLRNGRLVGTDVWVSDVRPSDGLHGSVDHLVMSKAHLAANAGTATDNVIIDGAVILSQAGAVTHSWIVRSSFTMSDSQHGLLFTITDNVIVNSPLDGIGVNTYFCCPDDVRGQIDRNLIVGSAANGVRITGDLDALGAVSISHNVIVGSGANGIELSGDAVSRNPGGPVTIGGNTTLFNHGHGIDAPWVPGSPSQVIDAGHNVALFNQARPKCVGVRCTP